MHAKHLERIVRISFGPLQQLSVKLTDGITIRINTIMFWHTSINGYKYLNKITAQLLSCCPKILFNDARQITLFSRQV